MERVDVIIVGAGVAGASAARALSERERVLVLEQGSQAGAEASAQNAGMLRRLVSDDVERALACASAARIEAWQVDGLPAEAFRQTGAVLAVHAPGTRADQLARAAADLVSRGLSVETPDQHTLAALAPALAEAELHQAWWLPAEGLLDANAMVQTGLSVARRRGARVEIGRATLGLLRQGDRVVGVRTPEGPVYAERVVLATGAWGAWLAASVGLARALVPLARHLLHSDPHPLARADHPYCWLDDEGLYLRPEGGGWLLSPCDEVAIAPPAGPGSQGPVSPEARGLAMEKLERLLPAIGPLRLPGGWTGLRTFSPDRRPWIGADPELAGLWWLSGLGGAGVTCGFALGDALVAVMEGGELPGVDLSALAPGRVHLPVRLPPMAERVLPGSGETP